MKIYFHQASRDDVTCQFRYYLVQLGLPEVAIRFREAVRRSAKAISQQPRTAPLYHLRNPQLQNLRSWPVLGFEDIRFYFILEKDAIRVIRILHGKRNIREVLEQEKTEDE
ncbi:MAG: type II toxin-antitoxin system RelE/ParE family toxin [Candidatus Solibacter usitatus]|nr:type II toxin-antitoxin system RelE/ParE family toxin [Candidatus Solibacter usitatus]